MTTTNLNGHNGLSLAQFDASLSLRDTAGATKRSNALSNRLTGVLSSSYTDSEVRDALRLLDARGARNVEETRSNLKYDAQKEVIQANTQIVEDFGKVAKQLQRVGALITILNQTCDDMRSHIQLARQETSPMLEEASVLFARKEETESKQHLLEAFNTHFLISDEDLTTLTNSVEPVNDQYFDVLARVKQIHKDCEILLGYENQRLGLELMEQTSRNLDAGYKKLYGWIQREFKGLDLEDPRTSGSIRKSLRALSERPTLFQNCLDLFGEAREVTLSDAFRTALTDSAIGTAKAIEFSTHDPQRYIGDMLAWVHSTTVSEKEALEGLFISDADEISRGLNKGKASEPWARLRRTSSESSNDEEEVETNTDMSSFDGHAALNSLISRNMASVSQTLQQRVSLTIRNLTDPLTIYKTYNLLLFYEDIFVKLLGSSEKITPSQPPPRTQPKPQFRNRPQLTQEQNTLLATLSSLQSQCLTVFTTILSSEMDSQPIEPILSLTPPSILTTNLSLLSSILTLRVPNITSQEFNNLYSTLLTPALELCASIAETINPSSTSPSSADPTVSHSRDLTNYDRANFEATLFKLNYLHPVIATFTDLSQNDKTLSDLITPPLIFAQKEISTLQDQFSDLLAENFLTVSRVGHLADLLDSSDDNDDNDNDNENENGAGNGNGDGNRTEGPASASNVKMKRKILLSDRNLEEASTSLDTFLASALMDAQDDLAKLSDKKVAKGVIASAVEEFCVEFERLVEMVELFDREWERRLDEKKLGGGGDDVDVENGDENEDEDEAVLLREVYPRTVGEVRALLS